MTGPDSKRTQSRHDLCSHRSYTQKDSFVICKTEIYFMLDFMFIHKSTSDMKAQGRSLNPHYDRGRKEEKIKDKTLFHRFPDYSCYFILQTFCSTWISRRR